MNYDAVGDGLREVPLNVKQRTSHRTESNLNPSKYMKNEEMDLYGFASGQCGSQNETAGSDL